MSGAPAVVVVGNVTIDDVVHPDGATTMASLGGNSIHVAVAARIWGVAVGMVARAGTDFPAAAITRLAETGVDTSGLRVLDGPTVRNWVVYEDDGRRHWVYRTPSGRRLELAPDPADVPADWLAGRQTPPVVHVAAMPFDAARRMVEYLRTTGPVTITLDAHEEWVDPDAVVPANDGERVDGALVEAVATEARRAMQEDAAEALVLGCAGLADLVEPLQRQLGIPVVEGVAAALKMVEGLLAQGLTTSRASTYARP